MSDFLLEIGTEEIPARMIDSAREELAKRVGDLLTARAPVDNTAVAGVFHAATAGGARLRRRCGATRRQRAGHRAVAEGRLQRRSAHSCRRSLCAQSRTCRSTRWRRSRRRRANISPRRYRRRAAPRPRFSPSRCRRKSPEFTGRRTCTGAASRRSASCARCAGWCRCSTAKSCRWSSPAFAPSSTSEGHRILSSGALAIRRPAELRRRRWPRARWSPAAAEREQRIRKALDAATRTIPGARWREDKSLLDTVVNLTEFPSVDPGQLRSRVSRACRRSAGHGDARPPEVLRAGRCRTASCCRTSSRC